MAMVLISCEPCEYHSHNRVEMGDEEFKVSTTDSIGDLLKLGDAVWNADDDTLEISVDYGQVNHDYAVSVYVDGSEIGTSGSDITFSMSDTAEGKDFTFNGIPGGSHVVLIAVLDKDTISGIGSLELRIEIPYSISFEEA